MTALFGIVAAFAFCVVALLIVLRETSIHTSIKIGMCLASLTVVYSFYYAVLASQGWPIAYIPTCTMLVEGIDVREPGHGSGAIYIWYIDVDAATISHIPGIPRSIVIPYSVADAKLAAKIQEQINEKRRVYVRLKGKGAGLASHHEDDRYAAGGMEFVQPRSNIPEKQ